MNSFGPPRAKERHPRGGPGPTTEYGCIGSIELAQWFAAGRSTNYQDEQRLNAFGATCYCRTMAIINLDIWRSASLMVKRQGRDAAIIAARRADECLAAGDMDGQQTWKRIVEATLELLRVERRDGEPAN